MSLTANRTLAAAQVAYDAHEAACATCRDAWTADQLCAVGLALSLSADTGKVVDRKRWMP